MKQSSVSQMLSKKAYQQPLLKTYGDLRRLTQAGTKGLSEGGSNTQNKKA